MQQHFYDMIWHSIQQLLIKQPAIWFKVDTKTKIRCKQTLKKTDSGGIPMLMYWRIAGITFKLHPYFPIPQIYFCSIIFLIWMGIKAALFHLFSVFTALFPHQTATFRERFDEFEWMHTYCTLFIMKTYHLVLQLIA